jgi:glycosyltransferase involved in cell wall biosynthesis
LLALPHTITSSQFSHCAFTGKILRFSPMMRSVGYEVYHYGVETEESGATKNIHLLTKDEWERLRIESYRFLHPKMTREEIIDKLSDDKSFVGDLGNWDTPLYKEFNRRLRIELIKNYRSKSTDIVCITFGPSHEDALRNLDVVCIETGIGYPNSYKDFRIFESYAKMHASYEQFGQPFTNHWFVIPNYFDTNEFPLSLTPKKHRVGYFGRILPEKGCYIIGEIAKKFPDVEFVFCGQGEPESFITEPNMSYRPPIHGKERGVFLGSLCALIVPSKYNEPFGGVNVEAQLCGTPVITHDFGAFVETVEPFKTGIHCHSLADFCYGIQMALDEKFDREYIHRRAKEKYDMFNIAHKYDYVFKTILEIYIFFVQSKKIEIFYYKSLF